MTDTPPDCFSPPKPLMTEADALTALKSTLRPVEEHETRPLPEAAGLYLSQPIRAPRAVPAHDNAAVDGYAVHSSIFNKPPPYRLPVVGTAWAGKPLETSVGPAEAARIFTGAVMPSGTDCVLMQEHVSAQNNLIEFSVNGREGLNRRLAGEDTGLNEAVLERGDRLGAAALATVASLGIGEVSVYRPLRVAVLSTGDELAEPGMAYRPGTVYDSNRPLLRALLSTYPVALTDLGSAADTRSEVESLLKTAARAHDLLITSGGASTGEGDHVTSAVQSAGELHLWRLAIKPGKPIGFGQIGACTVVCLPGNPVAAFTGFVLFIRPMLSRLGGGPWTVPRVWRVKAGFDLKAKKPGRCDYLRGSLISDETGTHVIKFPKDGSALLSSLRHSDGLIRLPEDCTALSAGEMVDFIPYTELGVPV